MDVWRRLKPEQVADRLGGDDEDEKWHQEATNHGR